MGLPKKGSRSIIVNDVKYRWIGCATNYQGEDYGGLIIELFNEPKQRIRANFTWTKLRADYKNVNHRMCKIVDSPPPYIVRQTVLYGLDNGWEPTETGRLIDFGNLDDKLNYKQMKDQN